LWHLLHLLVSVSYQTIQNKSKHNQLKLNQAAKNPKRSKRKRKNKRLPSLLLKQKTRLSQ